MKKTIKSPELGYLLESSPSSWSCDSLYSGTVNGNSAVQIVSSSDKAMQICSEVWLEHVPVKRVDVGFNTAYYRGYLKVAGVTFVNKCQLQIDKISIRTKLVK